MERFSRFVLAHRRVVGALWIVLFVGGGWASSILANHLNQSFTIDGTPSIRAQQAVVRQYHSGGDLDPLVPVVVLPAGVTPDAARASVGPALAAVPGRVVDYYNTGDHKFVGADGRTMFALVYTPATGDQPKDHPAVRHLQGAARPARPEAAARHAGARHRTSGSNTNVLMSGTGTGIYAVVPGQGTATASPGPWPLTVVLPVDEAATREGQHIAKLTRTTLDRTVPGSLVVSSALVNIDNIHKMYGQFPLLLTVLAIVTFLVLARTFRSLLLPAKAVLANLLSVAAAYGGMVLIWQKGYGSHAIWGIPATGGIPFWIPMIVFAFLYGLSMDYEVFILSRIREEYDAGAPTDQAVIIGLGRTGRLVTSAALILFLAFAALASAPFTFLKIFATGLGIGILLDATVVRALVVPALVSLFGRWNWWLPGWAARVLRTRPSS